MSSSVCRVCLCSITKGHRIENTYLRETYEKFAGSKLSTAEGQPTTICYFCNSQLKKSLRFFDMCQKSEKILEDLLHHGLELTLETLHDKHNLGWTHNLTVAALTPVYIDDFNNDSFKSAEKPETAEEIFVEIDPKQYVDDVEVGSDSCNERSKFSGTIVTAKRNTARLFNCEICNKTFRHKHVLKIHKAIHSGAKPYTCDICKRSFAQGCNLSKHMISHTGERPHICDICNRSFGHKYTLQLHMRTHTGQKPFTCNICSKTFSENGKLKRHNMQVHTGEKPYSCSMCHKSFNDNSSLRCHMGLHTGEKLYTCSVCGKSFGQNSTLTRHMRIHTDGKPFTCTICGKSYTQNSSLSTHFKRTHNDVKLNQVA